MTKISRIKYLCYYPRRLHIIEVDRLSGFRDEDLNFDISMTLGQGQKMTLTLINYTFINDSISCLHLQAAIVSNMLSPFPMSKSVSKIDLAVK